MRALRLRAVASVVLAGAPLSVVACGAKVSPQNSPTSEAASDDAAADAGPACAQSIDAYCVHPSAHFACDSTFSMALAGMCGQAHIYSIRGCYGFDVIERGFTDWTETYYFDSATGVLVAIVDSSANFGGSDQCVAGPPSFVEPQCLPGPVDNQCPPPDGGAFCKVTADCPQAPGACASSCADGTSPCAQVCVRNHCVLRGCPDGGGTAADGSPDMTDAAVE
ncbi:MAG: hypothetical protein ACRENE_17475 [Polyangiaceae bacterium]